MALKFGIPRAKNKNNLIISMSSDTVSSSN